MSPEETKLNPKQALAVAAVLAGKSKKEAAEESGLRPDHVRDMLSPNGRYPHVWAEYQRLKSEQEQRILIDEPDRSKVALLKKWDRLEQRAWKDGDLNTCARCLIEEGKLMGYYVDRKQIDGSVTVRPEPKYDWHSMPLEKRLEMDKELEAIKLEAES